MQVARRYLAVDKKKTFTRNFYPKSSLLSSFSATENEHLLFGFSTKIMSEKYMCKVLYFVVFFTSSCNWTFLLTLLL